MTGRYRYYKRKLYFTTSDRILIHLLDYMGREGELDQPDDITQFGIADAIGLGRSTVSKAIRRLQREKLVRSQRAHVPSGTLRRTVYILTPEGVTKATRRRTEIEEEVVAFRDQTGTERELRMSQVPRLLPEYATLLDVATHVSEGVFDVTTFRAPHRDRFVHFTERVPRLRYFFGRASELAAMDTWLESPTERVFVLTGITGIGKTTLLARKIEDWRGRRHILYHRLMEWTTLRNVLLQLAEFLTRLGKKGLAQYLEAEPAVDLEETVSILVADLGPLPAVLVYDDYHAAEPPIRNMFYSLRAAMEGLEGMRLVVAGRHVAPFYDRRDVRVRGVVHELALGGLDEASSAQILAARNLALAPGDADTIYRQTRGHPLFLELVDSTSVSTAEDVHKYLQEELLSRLTDAEAKVLEAASVFRTPVHADALFVDEGVETGTLRGLAEQSLLREVSARVYEIHDVLRAFFVDLMTPQERRRFHRSAANFLLSRPDGDALEALYHLTEAGEATSAVRLAVKERRAVLKSGRTEEMLRILERLLPAVEDPGHAAELRLLRARILDLRGEVEQAAALYRETLQLPPEPALLPKVAEAHRYLGDVLRREGATPEAEAHLDAALRLYRQLEQGEGQANTLLAIGQLAEHQEDFSRAERLYERAIDLGHTLGLRDIEAEADFAFARILGNRGDPQGALQRKERALAIAEGLADWHLQARFQVSIGTTLLSLDRVEEAMREYERGIETARRIGDLRMLAYGLYNAAGACIRQDDLMRADALLKEAEGLFGKLREPLMNALVLYYHGTLWERRGKWQIAKQSLVRSLDQLRESGHEVDFARTAIAAAHLFHRNGEPHTAASLVQEALSSARRLHVRSLVEEAQAFAAQLSRIPKDTQGESPGGAPPSAPQGT